MRSTVSTILELAGTLLLLVGAWFISPWLAVLLLGAGLLTIGYALGGDE